MGRGVTDMAEARKAESGEARVAVVIPCYRQGHFLAGAIESAIRQSVPPSEIIVVDDGSDDDTSQVARRYSEVTLVRHENRGLAAARNSGLRLASSEKIVFLDADDRLLPDAVLAGLRCFEANPDAGFVYGAFCEVRGEARNRGFSPVGTHRDLIRSNWVCCPAAVMFDRGKLLEVDGFDESLAMCEDWDCYLRLSRSFPFAAHPAVVADYVKHGANASDDLPELKKWIEIVRAKERERGLGADDERAWREGEDLWRRTLDPNRKPMPLIERAARKAVRLMLAPLRKLGASRSSR